MPTAPQPPSAAAPAGEAEAATDTLTDEQFAAMVQAQLKPARAAHPGAGASPAPITGQLTRAGTFAIRDEECTGLLISLSVDELRAIPSLPMYRRVAVVDAEALEQMQRENEHLRLLCADRDFHHAETLRQRAALTAIVRTWERESEACADNTNAGHAMATHARAALLPNTEAR